MPFPNYPDKHGASTHLTPEAMHPTKDVEDLDVPEAVILCYQPSFFEHVVESCTEQKLDLLKAGQFYTLSGTNGQVGVLGDFGIGAPSTALLMEQLIHFGSESFCIVGGCGGLGRNVAPREPVICESAVRDEGVSHHYLPSQMYASASPRLVSQLEEALNAAGVDYHIGASWTTDAFYRETVPEIEYYRDKGILTVEMEAAAVFAVAEYHGIDAAALLCPFDLVLADDWESKQGTTVEGLRDLLMPACNALTESLGYTDNRST